MSKTITSANSVFTLTVPGVFPVPITLQGYAVDDAFTTDAVDVAETQMGVDGKMATGFTPFIVPINISLQANSESASLFDVWLGAQEAAKESFPAFGLITMPSIGKSYVITNAALKRAAKFPGAKKVLQPVQYMLDCEQVTAVPLA